MQDTSIWETEFEESFTGRRFSAVKRLNDVDDKSQDQGRESQVVDTAGMYTRPAGANKVHIKYILQDGEEDHQQEQADCMLHQLQDSCRGLWNVLHSV